MLGHFLCCNECKARSFKTSSTQASSNRCSAASLRESERERESQSQRERVREPEPVIKSEKDSLWLWLSVRERAREIQRKPDRVKESLSDSLTGSLYLFSSCLVLPTRIYSTHVIKKSHPFWPWTMAWGRNLSHTIQLTSSIIIKVTSKYLYPSPSGGSIVQLHGAEIKYRSIRYW